MRAKLLVAAASLFLLALLATLIGTVTYKRMQSHLRDHLEKEGQYSYLTDTSLAFTSLNDDDIAWPRYRVLVTLMFPGPEGIDYYLMQWSFSGGTLQVDDPHIREMQKTLRTARATVETKRGITQEVENTIKAKLELTVDDDERDTLRAELQVELDATIADREAAIQAMNQALQALHTHAPELKR